MKTKLLILSLLIGGFSSAQFVSSAPWNSESKQQKTIDQMVDEFNQYWLSHDKNKKGSGYKPFMRWENHWRNLTNENGFLISADELWAAWQEKNQSKASKNLSSMSLPPSNWQPVGPFTHTNTGSWSSGQGRVNFVYQDPNNSNVVYIGSPAGGIWKSTDAGVNWTPLSDFLPQIGVSGIVVDHTDSNVIYIATGDKDASDTYSVGVLKSTDGGLTWNTTGLSFGGSSSFAGDLIMDPTNNQVLFCATSSGIYKTSNAGASWSVVQTGDFSQGSIRFKPSDSSIIYAVSANRFYKSTNSGSSFTIITTGLPFNSGRLLLDVTPANSNYIYILSATTGYAFQGIYRSTDSGTSFTARNTSTDVFESSQAWYDLALGVSDTNAEEIFTGCLNVWKSSNGGTSFTKINNWSSPSAPSYTHADIHYLGFYGGNLYAGTDGGVYVSQNGGTNFTDLTATAQISQFYKIAVSKQSAANMVGGLQDNGGHAYSSGQWKNYYGADGMDTEIDPTNPNLYYGFIQNGGSLYISSTAGNGITGSVSSPGGQSGNWVTPLATNSIGELFSGFAGLYKLTGGTWTQQNSGSIGSGNLELIYVDPTNDDIMYISNGSTLYKSTNHGVNFSSIFTASSTIRSIAVNSNNNNIVYLTTSGTGGQVLKSTNGGTTFTNITSGIPSIGKNVIVHQGQHPDNPLYVGTSLGVYYLDDTMGSWQAFDTNLPNVSVTDLAINLFDNKIIASTYGRGIWQTDIPVQLAPDDVKLLAINNPGSNVNCGNLTPEIVIENNGVNTINSVQIDYSVDGTPYNTTWNGTLISGATAVVTLPSLVLSRGIHTFNVTTTITNDAFSSNNNGTVSIYVNDQGTVGVVNTFENTVDELLRYDEGSTTALWVRGVRNGGALASGFGNNVFTTNLTGNYPDQTKSYLVSQCYNLTDVSSPEIHFDMKYDLELNWDIVYVEYTTDFGANWNVLGTMGANWYNSDRTVATAGNDCYNCPGAQWTGTNTTNTNYFYPLNSLIGEPNVIFRIVFHSDESVNQLGVNIDNFVITGTLSEQNFNTNEFFVYPNPSKGIFNISFSNEVPESIEIFEVTGKKVFSSDKLNIEGSIVKLDLTNLSSGIYFVKIQSNDKQLVKRIIKE
ncbi:T9SS type A sorting domain-containing protein [Flavobacterium okayamense]|uniref:Glycosyl hydrolase n=1 Tax=Flavobacterium okayamense TaxID=2830782 RepID=A0ABM7S4T7_9FLAO|nr:T9SS type A sorting domain-containing protein [Flavobacterium okayamense]BCY27932.1 glycosyl hydrolase [Flavobacterium okayamense]